MMQISDIISCRQITCRIQSNDAVFGITSTEFNLLQSHFVSEKFVRITTNLRVFDVLKLQLLSQLFALCRNCFCSLPISQAPFVPTVNKHEHGNEYRTKEEMEI